ncbi:hypothetical protein [uncultured Tenacibaculum sp.]|uniref:hypothetical protein n=1 Tax=uncultured Tenacibaculum sp. TaxID=174713 RepID=UPI002613490E|nr:hypothetical protein [uncultured Tenacibaculum sp.]
MSKLNVNGVEIALSAKENLEKTKCTLTGTFKESKFAFQKANDPSNNKYDGYAIEIITSTTSSSPISILCDGDPSDLWVWTNLGKTDVVGDPTTPRGTEVIVTSGTGEQ